jgi:hypothetical protein
MSSKRNLVFIIFVIRERYSVKNRELSVNRLNAAKLARKLRVIYLRTFSNKLFVIDFQGGQVGINLISVENVWQRFFILHSKPASLHTA